MSYARIIRELRERLDFVNDEQTADGATRAVLGILAARMEPERARVLAETFPGIDLQALRSREESSGALEDYASLLERSFMLNRDQARQVVLIVLGEVRKLLPLESRADIDESLPPDWSAGAFH